MKMKMKDDEEVETLLDEIPHTVFGNFSINGFHHHGNGVAGDHHDMSLMNQNFNGFMYDNGGMYGNGSFIYTNNNNNNNHTCVSSSPGNSGYSSLHSNGSSTSSLFSGGYSFSDHGSPTTPLAEESKPYSFSGTDYSAPPFTATTENVIIDDFSLSRNFDRLFISDETKDAQLGLNGRQFYNLHGNGNGNGNGNGGRFRLKVDQQRLRGDYNGVAPGAAVGLQQQYGLCNLLGSQYSYSQIQAAAAAERFQPFNSGNVAVNSQFPLGKVQSGHHYQTTVSRFSIGEDVLKPQRNSFNVYRDNDAIGMANITRPVANTTAQNKFSPLVRVPHRSFGVLSREDGLIIPGDGLNHLVKNGYGCPKGNINKGFSYDAATAGVSGFQERRSLFDSCAPIARSPLACYPFPIPSKYDSLADLQGCIYCYSKDQNGCRFLQRVFAEGTPEDVKIIFNGIIDHVVELMVNPFGNYLMQKLLEVCNEEQRMEILLRVTETPGELIRISLNTHGTRVVQKLIETLKSREQTSLVISALEQGFLPLIKDLNGNHVIQRCLQYLSSEDSKFIFVAAAKYCVDIATHQHGCCVLQKCIDHSTGEDQENLIAEISANGLLLAQDAYGNYVVQFILDHKLPSGTTKLLAQFDGNYVNLSTQKFSSHVVEKCLVVCHEEYKSKIIHELLSATHFEQLLQDPHANYVIQTALKVSEGPLYSWLVSVIESHKAMSRNSPYSKRIFSHKFLKK